jgi:predicted aspartyl protease
LGDRLKPLTTAIAAAFACLAFTPARAADCAPQQLAKVTTSTLADGRITIPVTIEGHALSFLLDTGGVSTTIKWEVAREMKLPVLQTNRRLTGVGGSTLNFALAGENFSVGSLKVENKPIYVESRPLPEADGTLAPDILRDYDAEIDLAEGSLSLLTPGYCAAQGGAVLAIDVDPNRHVRFPVKIDGATVIAALDTGSVLSVVSMRSAALLGVYPNSPGLRLLRDAGRYRLYTYPFQALDIGGVTVKNPYIVIASDGFLPGEDMVLGIDALRQMHLTIAYGSRRLYIKAPENN